ncbi:semaphorin-1A [Diabrotica virgifera virgifera]|uniref:Semaphorin-1A-like n=1 Tax=Diabrotica virgifera virgifera TaxID=50390 RepID=A0A6P7GGR7_DIAVI|nr:semaphorin-1A [Diabrotica virgifera virgifera]XP_050497232.1 semaphorin-1A [Diabrotica virgifera virgifera]
MKIRAFSCLSTSSLHYFLLILLYLIKTGHGWLPNTSTKLVNNANKIRSIVFRGNTSSIDHFTVLYQDDESILLGGRNQIYNLSMFDFAEKAVTLDSWPSSEAHSQLCILKGKTEDDCQNYIRILVPTGPGKFLICGTNSFKPICRILQQKDGQVVIEKELDGKGLCPYDPEHNSTSIYSNGHLFSATVADFSGTDPLIYKEPLRTELLDLRQLNAPNFVSSMTYGDYIYFFFRETAVEYMNCGKVIYSRVARICKHDKGGPRQSHDRWTTFLKARLNCSVPGEYPFYFDEIQSTSDIVEGNYGGDERKKIIYSALTTPDNAIGGSAICMFNMEDVQGVFQGPFKSQESINANWLPVPDHKVPTPRPGDCVKDSRVLAEKDVNFIKTHPLMEKAVPPLFGQPLLIRVSLHYRFTAVTVDPQVPTVTNENYDVIYVGTDDGKVLKVVNIPNGIAPPQSVVISENEVFPKTTPVKQLKITPEYGKIIAVSSSEVKLVTLIHCEHFSRCSDCLELRDPHCAWNSFTRTCVRVEMSNLNKQLTQDIRNGGAVKCRTSSLDNAVPTKEYDVSPIDTNSLDESKESNDPLLKIEDESADCNEINNKVTGCASQTKLTLYTSEYLHIIVAVACMGGLIVGFVCGYLVSRRFHGRSQYPNPPFIEQHNHLERLTVNQTSFLAPRTKTVNLDVLNVSTDSLPPKKDNLGSLKNLNITNEGTLQKIKKTYI